MPKTGMVEIILVNAYAQTFLCENHIYKHGIFPQRFAIYVWPVFAADSDFPSFPSVGIKSCTTMDDICVYLYGRQVAVKQTDKPQNHHGKESGDCSNIHFLRIDTNVNTQAIPKQKYVISMKETYIISVFCNVVITISDLCYCVCSNFLVNGTIYGLWWWWHDCTSLKNRFLYSRVFIDRSGERCILLSVWAIQWLIPNTKTGNAWLWWFLSCQSE